MLSDGVIITFITVGGSIITGYIALKLKNAKTKPDRVDTAFEMYEKIIENKDSEIKRLNDELEKERKK